MRIIELLNKIANGEEVPNKIHIKEFQSDFIFNGYTYLSDEKNQQNIYWCLHSEALNYEVEILDIKYLNNDLGKKLLEPFYKIEKLNENRYIGTDISPVNDMFDKINELIDEVNKLI